MNESLIFELGYHDLKTQSSLKTKAAMLKTFKRLARLLLPARVVENINYRRTRFANRKSERWAAKNAQSLDSFVAGIDALLWKEVKEIFKDFREENEKLIRRSGVKLGGGGAYSLLYFLVRKTRPKNVLETGVAAGWSSKAILLALEFNKAGHLYSSDFPYKCAGSEAAIGLLVDNHLKYRWTLCTQGDQSCLPDFVRSVTSVDFFHYDSSKTYEGRDYAWKVVQKKLSPGAIVIFDDIQDNFHFRDLTLDLAVDFTVIEFEGKYVGLFCSGDNLSLQSGGTDQRAMGA